MSDPIYVYKVFVSDGHEEPVRGCEFGDVDLRSLKRILAAGKEPHVLNLGGGGSGRSVVAPSIIIDEMELAGIEEEQAKPPILNAPNARVEDK